MRRLVGIASVILVLVVIAVVIGSFNAKARSFELLLQDPLEFTEPADRCTSTTCKTLLRRIQKSKKTIDFAIYGSRDQTAIFEAIQDAQKRGVRVRGYVDRDRHGDTYYASTDEWTEVLGVITDDSAREPPLLPYRGPTPRCDRPHGFEGPLQCLAYDLGDYWLLAEHASREDFTSPELGGTNEIMHHKFFVIDSNWVWGGSANISNSGTGGYNANVAFGVESEELARLYIEEFEVLLARDNPKYRKPRSNPKVIKVGRDRVEPWFSPQDQAMRYAVQPLIAKARKTIDTSIFFLTHKYIAADLINAHKRGVEVRVLVDATSAKNGYTKHELLRVAGVPVKVENWGGKMHAKAASVDGEYLIMGSMNWTSAGGGVNDENTLIVKSKRLGKQYGKWFDRLWDSIPSRWAEMNARPDPESQDSGTSCTDGVDNDFDDLVDSDDPGCSNNPPNLPQLPPHRLVEKTADGQAPGTHRTYLGTKIGKRVNKRWTEFAR